ncbi:cytosine permease [Diaminobutyricimonas sp. TR449]|uniref:purine-cytosine permease family protein n=1 Tax=Diaminobutyricimonas sp. TR449 TaxID=2708076 RepID=UPI00141DE761|nr:cytosine permease [Diaminobutyricimonas sp. TR449]
MTNPETELDDTPVVGPRRSTFTPPPGGYDESVLTAGEPSALPASPPFDPAALGPSSQLLEVPQPPKRRSLDDDEIVRTLEAANPSTETIELISQIQEQMHLREREVIEYREWEASVLELGTPEALTALEEQRGVFTGVIPVITAEDAYRVEVPTPSRDAPDVVEITEVEAGRADSASMNEDADFADAPKQAEAPKQPDVPVHSFESLLAGAPTSSHDEPELSAPMGDPLAPLLDQIVQHDEGERAEAEPADAEKVETDPAEAEKVEAEPADAEAVDGDTVQAAPVQPEPLQPEPPTAEPVSAPTTAAPAVVPQPQVPARVEVAGTEPTALELRTGRATRMFWLWFGATAQVIGVGVGAVVFSLGLSLRQAIVAVLVGVALSFLPVALGTLAGKWNGQPAMVVSRATFGVLGNILPAIIAALTRVFWGAALLWLLVRSAASALGEGAASGTIEPIVLGTAFIAAIVIAYFGFRWITVVQAVLGVVSGLLVVFLIVATLPRVDIPAALEIPDGDWLLAVGGAVIVFSFVGLAWAMSSSDLARYQRPSTSGGATMVYSTLGATVPAFVVMGWGAVLAASDLEFAAALAADPVAAISEVVPGVLPMLLLVALGLNLLSGVILALYSGAFAVQAVGVRMSRQAAVVISGALVIAVAAAFVASAIDLETLVRDLATTVAVPVAAWVGVFAAEMMIRNRRFDSGSLLNRGGRYPDVRWVNLVALVVISAIGFGLTSADVSWLTWQGYLFSVVGVDPAGAIAAADLGVLVAVVLGLAVPLAAGVGAVRRQEADTVRLVD